MDGQRAKLEDRLYALGIDVAIWEEDCAVYITRPKISAEAVMDELLTHTPHVERLWFIQTPLDVATARKLARLRRLENLVAVGCEFPPDAIVELAKSKSLGELHLCLERDPDAELEAVCRLKRLWRLGLVGSQMSDDALQHLAGLTKLEHLDLSSCLHLDAGLRVCAQLPALRDLNLEYSSVTDAGARALSDAKQLSELSIAKTRVTSAGVEAILARIPLESLLAADLKLDHRGIAAIARCETLKHVMLFDVPLQYDDLIQLSGMPKLEKIYFTRSLLPPDGEEFFASIATHVEMVVTNH